MFYFCFNSMNQFVKSYFYLAFAIHLCQHIRFCHVLCLHFSVKFDIFMQHIQTVIKLSSADLNGFRIYFFNVCRFTLHVTSLWLLMCVLYVSNALGSFLVKVIHCCPRSSGWFVCVAFIQLSCSWYWNLSWLWMA